MDIVTAAYEIRTRIFFRLINLLICPALTLKIINGNSKFESCGKCINNFNILKYQILYELTSYSR